MTTSTTPSGAPRPFSFGFARPAARPNPAASPSVPAASTAPISTSAIASQEVSSTTVEPVVQVSQVPQVAEAALVGTDTAAAPGALPDGPEHERIAVMLGAGGREGLIFGGVFGRMEDGKFRTDALLKSIYLLQLVDGAEPNAGVDQVQRDLMAAMGGLPESTVIAVPAELAPSFKATLAQLSGQRWERLYSGAIASSNPMARFALANEQRIAQETVARIVAAGGASFTVQRAAPKQFRFTNRPDDEQDNDESGEYWGYGPEARLQEVQPGVAAPVVASATADNLAQPADAPSYEEFLHAVAGAPGRAEGDVVTFNLVESFTVVADSPEAAMRILELLPRSLLPLAGITVTDAKVNGEDFTMPAPPVEEDSAGDAPR